MGGRVRQGLDSEVVNFQLDSLFSPRPCTKVIGKEGKMAAYYSYIQPSGWPEKLNSSIQVKLYEVNNPVIEWLLNSMK